MANPTNPEDYRVLLQVKTKSDSFTYFPVSFNKKTFLTRLGTWIYLHGEVSSNIFSDCHGCLGHALTGRF